MNAKYTFVEAEISKEQWERVEKDLRVQTENPAQVGKPSTLTPTAQQTLMKIVLRQGTDGWKTAADTLGLKNAKEAIFEFLRIEDSTILQA